MSDNTRQQLERAVHHIFAGRKPCEYDYMRTVPSWHRTDRLPGRCRLHGLPIGRGRRTACGPECSEAGLRLAFWETMCHAAWERDEHRCRECGKELRHRRDGSYHHVIEVNKGGGQLGLDNIQTLCVPCHDAKTAAYAAERAALRRQQKPAPEWQQLEMAQ